MTDYLTLLGTAFNKQPQQLSGIATRIIKSQTLPRLPIDIDARYENQIPDNFTPIVEPIRENTVQLQESTTSKRDEYQKLAKNAAAGKLTFLNDTVMFQDGSNISMGDPLIQKQSLHWKLKCYGFEHLEAVWLGYSDPKEITDRELDVHRDWLADWRGSYPIAANTNYLRQYWMPHSVCLRILNWARYDAVFCDRLDPVFREEIKQLVYKNGAFLSDNVEHGVGGNHLVENAVALVVAGIYANKQKWKQQGRQLFERAAANQFFDDGGHFERSPMYHLIVCQRYLTAHSLMDRIGDTSGTIKQCAEQCIHFLEYLRPPDGCIPLLNDSVFGEALTLDDCLAYGQEVGIANEQKVVVEKQSECMPESGFYWLGEDESVLLAAAHEVAVPHIPAHAHAHPGQICLWINGKRILTDTGVYEYATGQHRQNARTVGSHNTIQVGDSEPVRMDSSFWLCGKLNPSVDYSIAEQAIKFSYSVNGIGRPTYQHTRDIKFEQNAWRITDHVEAEQSPVQSRLHVHPRYNAEVVGDGIRLTDVDGETVVKIVVSGNETIAVETTAYYPEYGREISRDVVVICGSELEPLEMHLIQAAGCIRNEEA